MENRVTLWNIPKKAGAMEQPKIVWEKPETGTWTNRIEYVIKPVTSRNHPEQDEAPCSVKQQWDSSYSRFSAQSSEKQYFSTN